MLHEPRCTKCGGNTRLVSFRRNDGKPSWTCATCAGQQADYWATITRCCSARPDSTRR